MASLKNIKLRILSYKKTGTVTHAMEAVSAVKMRKSQERALAGRAYAAAGLSILERISSTVDFQQHPLMKGSDHVQTGLKTCFILITSDKGLAGSLNSGVIRLLERELQGRGLAKEDVVILAAGRRGGDYFAARGYDVRAKYENLSDDISEPDVREMTDKMIAWTMAGELARCFVVYQNFISTFEQQPTMRQVVPVSREMVKQMVAGIRPAKGRYAPLHGEEQQHYPASYVVEPDPDRVLATLLPRLLNIAVFHALIETKASEHSARMVAMKSATDKARDMAHGLTRIFNRVRQAQITREVSEITSGIEAMR